MVISTSFPVIVVEMACLCVPEPLASFQGKDSSAAVVDIEAEVKDAD